MEIPLQRLYLETAGASAEIGSNIFQIPELAENLLFGVPHGLNLPIIHGPSDNIRVGESPHSVESGLLFILLTFSSSESKNETSQRLEQAPADATFVIEDADCTPSMRRFLKTTLQMLNALAAAESRRRSLLAP